MDYKWDVFLSYRRYGEWPVWVKQHLYGLLLHWLGEELGTEPRIYYDTEVIKTGIAWHQHLAENLSKSKAMITLWSRQYFQSEWCCAELNHMLERERSCGLTVERLIVPAIIHDGDDIPDALKAIQALPIQQLANPRMRPDGQASEQLSERVRDWVPDIRDAIRRAPPWDPAWAASTAEQFEALFSAPRHQTDVPAM